MVRASVDDVDAAEAAADVVYSHGYENASIYFSLLSSVPALELALLRCVKSTEHKE